MPFPIDPETMATKTDHINHLMQSFIDNGYIPDRPMVVAVNKPNPKIHRQLIHGRQRSWTLAVMKAKGMSVPTPKDIVVVEEKIVSYEHLLARQAFYDDLDETKPSSVSRARINKNMREILNQHPEIKTPEKAIKLVEVLGFHNKDAVRRNFEYVVAKRENRPVTKPAGRPSPRELFHRPEEERLRIQNSMPLMDDAVSVNLDCPECHHQLQCYKCQSFLIGIKGDDGSFGLSKVVSPPTAIDPTKKKGAGK